jgi:hypothetical protein
LDHIPEKKIIENFIWRLYLPKMQWFCEGKYNPIIQMINPANNILSNGNLLFISTTYFEINQSKNKIYKFEQKYFPNNQYFYIEGNKIIGVFQNNYLKYFEIVNISDIRGKLKATYFFISPLKENNNLKITLLFFMLSFILVLILFFRKKIKAILKPFNGIVFIEKKQIFVYKRKPILFEENEKIVLSYLLNHLNKYISLNELNQLFEKNNQPETISATVKRREQAVSSLLIKVSKITGIEEKKLILERRNIEDKRIKDILLLPYLLKKEI